jgi:glycogen synthase
MKTTVDEKLLRKIGSAQFFMLRYETEFTPCTGITAVTKQERRNFKRGIMIAPWCPKLKRDKPQDDPLASGKVKPTDWTFKVNGRLCRVLVTTDEFAPILFLALDGRFEGIETPYDVPLPSLREDTLWFGLAVDELLKVAASPQQFVWAADWETVPAMVLVRERHHVSLTLHNTFDECLVNEIKPFGKTFLIFGMERKNEGIKTALEIGLELADVVTTVNRGFAYGMRSEAIQTRVMAPHLQGLIGRVVGINNAAFSKLDGSLLALKQRLIEDPEAARKELFNAQAEARKLLPAEISSKCGDKVIVISMGRRVAQKLHDVMVESTRQLLSTDKNLPLFVVFTTVHGDSGSPARLKRMQALAKEFPNNVACLDGRLTFFSEMMRAADYNCMPSLYEPHGGAYEGSVIPIARAVDGLAEQIRGLDPKGEAARMNDLWHPASEAPSGLLFREGGKTTPGRVKDLAALLSQSPSPNNKLFKEMTAALSEELLQAVELRLKQPEKYAELVLAAIEKQEGSSWEVNLGGMQALIEEARLKRKINA